MEFVLDLHLHSRFSRAVSQKMNLHEMSSWAKLKGLQILSAADFTHPVWLREIKSQLKETNEGLYSLKEGKNETRFLLSTEIASIYKQGEKLRRIHNLIFAPNFETVDKINKELLARGCNLGSDGRPIVGLSSKQLLELVLTVDKQCMVIPCHVWTPHFGVYGSASGFESLEEAFGDLANHIYGIETGISSDPLMNWQVKELESRSILSFSDAHSAPKMGREATVITAKKDIETLAYSDIGKAIVRPLKLKKGLPVDDTKIAYSIEFYPEEGKYHFAGHRNCKVVKSPEEIKKEGNICPQCSRRLTEGVMYRVEQLAGKKANFEIQKSQKDKQGVFWIEDPDNIHPPFLKLVPLQEIIAESIGYSVISDKTRAMYISVCQEFGSELSVLLKIPIADIEKKFPGKLAEGIRKVRESTITIKPGYDGEYGVVSIWSEEEEEKSQQPLL